jgi:hypothetical protein
MCRATPAFFVNMCLKETGFSEPRRSAEELNSIMCAKELVSCGTTEPGNGNKLEVRPKAEHVLRVSQPSSGCSSKGANHASRLFFFSMLFIA